MGIVTPSMRKMIKGLLVTKYIDSCGIKMPQMPVIPNFTLPPMPSLDSLYSELDKVKSAVSGQNNESIYTKEYLDATRDYQQRVLEAANIYKLKTEELESKYSGIKNMSIQERLLKEIEKRESAKTILEEYEASVEDARIASKIDEATKFKKITSEKKSEANKAAEEETESKKNKEKKDVLEFLEKIILKQYEGWLKAEAAKAERFKDDIVAAYNDTVNLFKQVKSEAKTYFEDGGPGDKFVEEECDKIDRIFENFKESFTELSTDLVTLTAKIPNPDVIVAGAATGIPNPAQKVMIFMENMKKVLTDIKKISNYIKEILAIASAIGFAIKDLIPAFKELCDAFDKSSADSDKAFKQAVKHIRKRQKWYLEHEHPDEEGETKLAGYMYADVEVDWVSYEITVKGYKCYCRKDYAKMYTEKGQIKKSYWENGYRKNRGTHRDSSGKYYYYIPADEIGKTSEYDEEEIIRELEKDGEDLSAYDVDLGSVYNDNEDTTTLSLSDGRTITIDYLAASGDVIRLNDGSIIRVR